MLLYTLTLSNSAYICYTLMLATLMCNGGLLYIPYSFLVFAYALVLEWEPGKRFWHGVVVYSICLVIA